jgi:hypothetical protein
MKYEIQQYTLCDGWINTWSIEESGVSKPLVFDSKEEAQKELDDFLREIAEEIKSGERAPEHGYDAENFRIEEVKDN